MLGRIVGFSQYEAVLSNPKKSKFVLFKIGERNLDRLFQRELGKALDNYAGSYRSVAQFVGAREGKELIPYIEFIYD